MGKQAKKKLERRVSGIGFGKPSVNHQLSTSDAVLIAGSNMDGYFTEVLLYKQHEIIIRKHVDSEYYEAFIGDLDYPVKAPFADRKLALDLAKEEVNSLIRSFAT